MKALPIIFGYSTKNRYRKDVTLGNGSYGTVYKAYDFTEKIFVALKEIKNDAETNTLSSTTYKEILILRNIDHPNIVKYFFEFHDNL